MAIQEADLSYVLSGGIANNEPNDSLGGFPSPTPIPTGMLENLFSNISPRQAAVGKMDYRCFYIFNDNFTDSMYDFHIWLEKFNDGTTDLQMGFFFQDETQIIKITPPDVGSSPPPSGGFQIVLGSLVTDIIDFTEDDTDQAENIQEALRAVLEEDVDVEFQGIGDDSVTREFLVSFYGINKSKSFDVIEFQNNTTVPEQTLNAIKGIVGSPINTVAPDIGDEKLAPTNVTFATTTKPGYFIGTLHPSEGFPVWIRREVPFGSEPIDDDGAYVKCRVKSSPLLL